MSVTANLTTNVETITATIVVEDETIIAEINTAARGPAGPAGGGSSSITSATTSDGTADLSLSNVTTATATVSGTLTADHIHGNLAGNVYGHVRAGETLAKGDPVYVSGSHGSGSTLIPIVSKADASNAAKMPAIGIMDAAVANNANGHMVIIGTITELNTVGYSINAELYVAAGGGLAVTPPTGRAQPVARVERANGTNGAIIVKVNGLSASAATANTLVLRDASGGAQFSDLVASTSFDAGMFAVDPLVGSTFEAGSSIAFNSTAYTYGTGAASAHRIALGAGTTGATLFGAATAAAARAALGIQTKTGTSTGLAAVGVTDITGLTGYDLEADTWYKLELQYLWTSTSSNFQINFVTTGTLLRGGTTPANGQANSATGALSTSVFVNDTSFQLRGNTGETRTNAPAFGYAYFKTGTAGTGKLQLQLLAGTTLSTITSSCAVLTKQN
jgi:hypothetical protein